MGGVVHQPLVHDGTVKIWFQNRRTKWKKHDNITNAEAAEHKGPPNGTGGGNGTTTAGAGNGSGAKRPGAAGASSAEEHSSLDGSESCFSTGEEAAHTPPIQQPQGAALGAAASPPQPNPPEVQ
ncbi:hypothetical protein AAG570_002814 [Ranatra chinensis]|uniref:Homeobox domain-containing protein n=1 Tax=Ranatra chinensis TaxID=642074 RepID=A0ABD0YRR0_9HEMI